jgi:hypothetical protein
MEIMINKKREEELEELANRVIDRVLQFRKANTGSVFRDMAGLDDIKRAVDEMTRLSVANARANGLSWEMIGAALGLSKQCVWERYNGTKQEED